VGGRNVATYNTKMSNILVGNSYDINSTNSYKIVSYHRGAPTKNKSVWIGKVNYHDEIECFILTLNKNWIIKKGSKMIGWGLHLDHNQIIQLGIGTSPNKTPLYVAQFKREIINNEWHGYPIDYTNTNESPDHDVIEKWKNNEYISKRQENKMKRCLECI